MEPTEQYLEQSKIIIDRIRQQKEGILKAAEWFACLSPVLPLNHIHLSKARG